MGLALRPDGTIVVAAAAPANEIAEAAVLFRYTTAGARDATFGTAGKLVAPLGPSSSGQALLAQADGSVLMAVRIWTQAGDSDFGVIRLLP
jgi:hypothetical protein